MATTIPPGTGAAVVAAGTSLAVLQHYLDAGIEIMANGEKATLDGFACNQVWACRDDWRSPQNEYGVECFSLDEALPILLPFAALCQPLPTGEVPAVEVAKLILDLNEAHCEDGYLDSLKASLDIDGWLGDCLVVDESERVLLSIYTDWLLSADDTLVPVEAYDYLRSKHFALPVNGRPLVAGVDYIEKQPAAPASGEQKGGQGE